MYYLTHTLWIISIITCTIPVCYAQINSPSTATVPMTQGFTLRIPKQYLDNPDFKYGLELVEGPAYMRDVFRFQQYALVWQTKAAKGYFRYVNKQNDLFEPTESNSNPVGFLIAYRGMLYQTEDANPPKFNIAWLCRPSNTQQSDISIIQVFKDIMREKVGNSNGTLLAQNLHLLLPNHPNPDPSTTKLVLWNNCYATNVSFKPERATREIPADSTYQLYIPLADLTQTDFSYGLQKGEPASGDRMAYAYYPVFYNNAQQYDFKYNETKTFFVANRNENDTLQKAYFVLTLLGNDIEPTDLEFQRVPADRQTKTRSIIHLFTDFFRYFNKPTVKDVQLIYDKQPHPGDERLNRFAIWNDSQAIDISFETPAAYFYIDMSKTIDRDVLIKELEEQIAILDGKKEKFLAYISNGETPLIADDLKSFRQIMLRLWTLSPPSPSVGYDIETLKAKIGPDIEYLSPQKVDLHFYVSDNLCSNSLNKFIGSLLPNAARLKSNVYIHLEAQDKTDNTYFSKCQHPNTTKDLKPQCLKIIRDKQTPCDCDRMTGDK